MNDRAVLGVPVVLVDDPAVKGVVASGEAGEIVRGTPVGIGVGHASEVVTGCIGVVEARACIHSGRVIRACEADRRRVAVGDRPIVREGRRRCHVVHRDRERLLRRRQRRTARRGIVRQRQRNRRTPVVRHRRVGQRPGGGRHRRAYQEQTGIAVPGHIERQGLTRLVRRTRTDARRPARHRLQPHALRHRLVRALHEGRRVVHWRYRDLELDGGGIGEGLTVRGAQREGVECAVGVGGRRPVGVVRAVDRVVGVHVECRSRPGSGADLERAAAQGHDLERQRIAVDVLLIALRKQSGQRDGHLLVLRTREGVQRVERGWGILELDPPGG